MSFGFGGGNNNNTSSFGGFGSSNTGGGGFGANNASSGSSLFGGNTATSGGGFGGFGSSTNNSSPFGQQQNKPAFGAPATTSSGGGGVFGGNTSTAGGFGGGGGGGGFGASTNTGGGFGGNAGGGKHASPQSAAVARGGVDHSTGLFGQNKPSTPGFGSNTSTGSSLFGGGGNTTGGGFGTSNAATNNPFGANNNTNTNTGTGFGAPNTGGGFTFGGASSTANNNNGTAGTPFNAWQEKDGQGQTSYYQSITFQQPYGNKSFEELRTEDYAQGRKFGNSNGQAGSFGQSTGFGGFGATSSAGGGGFGAGNNTATSGGTGFGASTGGFGAGNTTGGFGANNNTGAGSMFGGAQNKPAGGGVFGATSTANNTGGFGGTAGGGGGLFGNNANTGNTGGGLFGANNNNNQQQQNKPAFGGFGASTNTGGGFGANTNTNTNTGGGGLFGAGNSNTGGGMFGGNQQQPQQQQGTNPFGAANTNTGGGMFGNNQAKPAGGSLFGGNTNTTTGGGLFGAQNNQQQQQQQQSNAFGASTNTGGGLFGGNQNKPAGTGLFGASTNNTNTGGGMFGAQNNQQQQGGSSLFGGGNANAGGSSLFGNQNKPSGSLFGGNANQSNTGGGSSLFGGNQQNQQGNTGSSLFGGGLNQNNQNQQGANNNSLFGGSLAQNNQQAAPQNQLHASLTGAPYGNEQLFTSLAAPSPPVGPLATPLSGARPSPRKTPSLLANARLNTPVYSPRGSTAGRNNTFGFSYSTYGTPGSAYTSGSLTPGASSLLKPTGSFGSALTSRLNKSFSTSNLRGDSPAEGRSLLRASAFSPGGTPGRYQNGGMRKLKIDRSLRTDLFGSAESTKSIEPAKESEGSRLRKGVSFEETASQSPAAEASSSNALVRTEDEEESQTPTLMRAAPAASSRPEMEQVNGALTTVPEDAETARPTTAPATNTPAEKISRRTEVGDYWTKPAMRDLRNMSRQQLKNVGNFTVGREGVGRIEFGSVDLTNTPLDDICGSIVQLNPRSATVYQDDADKPSMGKALNVPSIIFLENSWPRSHGGRKPVTAKSGKEYDKHIARLKRVAGTHFQSYNPDTGVWCFKVDHFTTYGLDDDDDESDFVDDEYMHNDSSALSDPPATPSGQQDVSLPSMETGSGEVDDTFQFKLNRRSQHAIPGGFDSEGMTFEYDEPSVVEGMQVVEPVMSGALDGMDDPFTSPGGAVQAPSPGAIERYHSSIMEDEQDDMPEEEQDIPGSFVAEPKMPRSILKPSMGLSAFVSPEKLATETWEEQLQRTMSPKKRDRQALREMQQSFLKAREGEEAAESPFKNRFFGQSALDESVLAQSSAKKAKVGGSAKKGNKSMLGESRAFEYSRDIMDSLWATDDKGRKTAAAAKGFENPYPKKRRLSSDAQLRDGDRKWHEHLKPSFANDDTLVFAVPGSAPHVSGELVPAMQSFVGEHKDVRFARFAVADDINPTSLVAQKNSTPFDISSGFPVATAPRDILFGSLAEQVDRGSAIAKRERSIWILCSIFFDPLNVGCARFMQGVPEDKVPEFEPRMRLDAFAAFWADLVGPTVRDTLKTARTAEEKALVHLTQNDVVAACEALMSVKDFKLATLVSQLPGTEASRELMKEQIAAWRERNDWSEMSAPVRAIYSVLAGDVCVVEGKSGAAENRVAEFSIAEAFGLNWQQSFGLRLFFGGYESSVDAVEAYVADLDSGREKIAPTMTWPDGTATRDTLMDLLRLASSNADPMPMLDARAVSGSAFNSRLTWQLATLLSAKGICAVAKEQLDQLTIDYATQLETADQLVTSAWTLLHLRDGAARTRAITNLLDRNGDQISTPDASTREEGTYEHLVHATQIPAPLVWKAKALHAQSGLRDPALQTHWLLNAGLVDAAHHVLCTTLGPQAVIEQDFAALAHTLHLFTHTHQPEPEGWRLGGQMYVDFVRLVEAQRAQKWGREMGGMVQRLQVGLVGLEEQEQAKRSLEERVAGIEMGRVLEEALREHEGAKEEEEAGRGGEGEQGQDLWRRYQRGMRGLAA